MKFLGIFYIFFSITKNNQWSLTKPFEKLKKITINGL